MAYMKDSTGRRLDALEVVAASVPSYAGARSKTWSPELSLYNQESPALRTIRGLVAKAKAGQPVRALAMGDSKTAGFGVNAGGAIVASDSYPGQLRDILGGRDWFIYGNTFHGSGVGGIDTRWSSVVGFTRDPANTDGRRLYLKSADTGTSSIRLTVDSPTTAIRLYGVSNDTGAVNVSVSIDGGAAVTWVAATGAAWQSFDVRSLVRTSHTVDISVTGKFWLLGAEIVDGAGGLQISNAGMCSATAYEWVDTTSFTNLRRSAVDGPGVPKPDFVLVNLGTNWTPSGVSNIGNIATYLAALNIPAILLVPGGIANDATYDPVRLGYYALADSADLPLIDLTNVIGNYAVANARGLSYDTLHENAKGYRLEAAAIARVLTGASAPVTYGMQDFAPGKPVTWLSTSHRGASTTAQIERLYMGASVDGENFTQIDADYTPLAGTVRDPSPYWHTDGKLYIAHTTVSFTGGSSFAVAVWDGTFRADDGRPIVTHHATVDCSAIAGTDQTWAPEWFIDSDGSPYILIALSTTGSAGPFQQYEVHPTNAAMTTWSAPALMAGFPANIIDVTVYKRSGTYHAWYKVHDASSNIEHATATALTGPYTTVQSGAALGFRTATEAPTIVDLGGGTVRMYTDAFNYGVTYCAESTDLSTWTNYRAVNVYPSQPRHMGFIKDASKSAVLRKLAEASKPIAGAGLDTARPGVLAPASGAWAVVGNAPGSNAGRLSRFIPPRDMTARQVAFYLVGASAADDPIDVRIWDAALTTIARAPLGVPTEAGAKVNVAGRRVITLTTPVRLKAGQVYYASFAIGTWGGGNGPSVMAAQDHSLNASDFGPGLLIGTEVGQADGLQHASLYNAADRLYFSASQATKLRYCLAVME